jgi:ABC-type multidrug transport system fused ATPase/permease subunit
VVNRVSRGLSDVLAEGVAATCLLTATLAIDWRLGLGLVVLGPAEDFLIRRLDGDIRALNRKVRDERALVTLARALPVRRPALVLDEAFAGLEPATIDAIWRSLEARRPESTTLVLTTDAAVASPGRPGRPSWPAPPIIANPYRPRAPSGNRRGQMPVTGKSPR